jgi:predicted Zn-dependent protease
MSKTRTVSRSSQSKEVALWTGLFLVAAGVYLNTLFYEFVWDDIYLILEDHTVKSLRYLATIFTSDFFGHQEDDLVYGYFRPLISLSYFIDYAIWRTNALGYHLTNILFHGLSTLLVAAALMQLKISRVPAFVAALLFAVHPMHTESVAWISGRTDLIAFAFALVSFVTYRRIGGAKRKAALKIASVVSFAFAILAKEMAVVVVLWMGIADVVLDRRDRRSTALSLFPYLGVAVLYLVWRFGIVDVAVPAQRSDVSWFQILASAPWTILRYLSWLFVPVSQSAYVRNPHITGLGDVRLYVGIAIVAGLAYLFYRIRVAQRIAFALSVMLVASFLPVLNLIAVSAPADMGNTMAERFLYFPSFPFVALTVMAGALFLERFEKVPKIRIVAWTAVVLVTATLAGAAILRNRVWKNNEVFYKATLESSSAALMLCNLANHYIYLGKWDEAKQALEKAKKGFADDYHYLSSMASWYVAQRRYEEAIRLQKKVAKKVERGRAVAYNNLAFLYRVTGDYKRAEHLLREVIYNGKGFADVYFNLGEVYRKTGRLKEAIENYREALERRPDNLQMATALAGALMQGGKLDHAVSVFENQLEMHRDNPGLLNNLGVVYNKMERPKQARKMFERSLKQDPSYAKARLNLAGALMALKREEAAITELRKIIRTHPKSPEATKAEQILREIEAPAR